MKKFKFHYNTIGDCFYDIYCQPNCTKKEDLLKDMAGILNGELTPEDFKKEILQWIGERSDECYLDDDCQIIVVDSHPPEHMGENTVVYYSGKAERPPYGFIDDEIS